MAGVKLRFVTGLRTLNVFTDVCIAQLITATDHAVVVRRVQIDIDGSARTTSPACYVVLKKMADGIIGATPMTTLAATKMADDPETIQTICRHFANGQNNPTASGGDIDSKQIMVSGTAISSLFFNFPQGLKVPANEGFGIFFDDGISATYYAKINVTIDFEE